VAKWRDWDSTVSCDAQSIQYPTTIDEVAAIVSGAVRNNSSLRVFGAGHSWSPLVPCGDTLINLDRMPCTTNVGAGGKTTLSAGMRLRDAGPLLQENKLCMQNLGAITPQSIAGAMGSGTHGSGMAFGILGTQASAIKIVDGRGDLREFNISDHPEEMSALRLSLGALGVIVEVTLDCVADHSVRLERQLMDFEDFLVQMRSLYEKSERMRAYWIPGMKKVYVHTMNTVDAATQPGSVYSWWEAHVVWQLLLGSVWWLGRTLPPLIPLCNKLQYAGFSTQPKIGRMFNAITTPIPAHHQESEVAVPIEHAADAVRAYDEFVHSKGYLVNMPTEIRFCKADDILLSPNYGRDTCYIGGYNAMYQKGSRFMEDYCSMMAERFDARPHWGKIGAPNRAIAQKMFPGFSRFEKIRREFDPHGVFINDYLREVFAL
jgi:FAD/FMN-containing dehydrogenase